jgi:hypothetical protein
MCFCEPVSFVAGGVLIVGGAFAGWKAFKINKRYFPFLKCLLWPGSNNSWKVTSGWG